MLKINKYFLILLIITFFVSCTPQKPQINITPLPDENSQSGSIDVDNSQTVGYNGKDHTALGLEVSDNFTLSIFAAHLPGARDIVGPDARGNFWLSRTSEGVITFLETENGDLKSIHDIISGLDKPHGLALAPDGVTLFVAETNKVSKIRLYSDASPEKLVDLPKAGRHFTRSLLYGPDEKLYISIGSTCDTCYEKDEQVASIYRINLDGSEFEKVASGLRNSVFMNINPVSGEIWATEMGRDHLGDDTPPDEINIISKGNNYGWPLCYGKNIHDTVFDTNIYKADPCIMSMTPSHIDLQAHSAPLGLAFIPEEGWPEGYWNDLFVAYHGSWNRSEPTGYKIVHITLDDKGSVTDTRDFIKGWNANGSILGRPVDILTTPGGVGYITDDEKGVVYKLTYNDPNFIYKEDISFTDETNRIGADIQINENNEILINGKASGSWYFEAIFGVELVDENNTSLIQSYVTAQSEWMTSDYVPFHALLKYENPQTDYGYIIFHRANASGLEEHNLEKRVKVKLR